MEGKDMARSTRVVFVASILWAFGLGAASPVEASVVQVTPGSMGNWAFDNRDANGVVGANPTASGSMVTGPATPPLGVGSANLATGNGTTGGDGASELRTTGYAGDPLSSITALSYSTYQTQNNGQQFPYLRLTISTTGIGPADDIVFFEPPYQTPTSGNPSLPNQGDTALNTWQTWNAFTGGWWDNQTGALPCNANPGTGVQSLAFIEACYPNALIEDATSGLGAIGFDVGFASATDQFNGYVDNFTIGINSANTTFDFEPGAVPEPSTISVLGLGLLALGLMRRKRRISLE